MTKLTPEQKATQDRIKALKPLRDLVDTPEFAALLAGLQAQRGAFIDEPGLFPHINGLVTIMTGLAGALAKEPQA